MLLGPPLNLAMTRDLSQNALLLYKLGKESEPQIVVNIYIITRNKLEKLHSVEGNLDM